VHSPGPIGTETPNSPGRVPEGDRKMLGVRISMQDVAPLCRETATAGDFYLSSTPSLAKIPRIHCSFDCYDDDRL
jgi:hypothetical protein